MTQRLSKRGWVVIAIAAVLTVFWFVIVSVTLTWLKGMTP
jgi:hypothetical protein